MKQNYREGRRGWVSSLDRMSCGQEVKDLFHCSEREVGSRKLSL
jgi:hypothetical protein